MKFKGEELVPTSAKPSRLVMEARRGFRAIQPKLFDLSEDAGPTPRCLDMFLSGTIAPFSGESVDVPENL